MKPEHFIYKSDGLYYMQNVPEKPTNINYFDCSGPDGIKRHFEKGGDFGFEKDLKRYNEALERAKAEAVKCDQVLKDHIDNILYKNTDTVHEGEIYTINMEEKIEKIYQSRFRRWMDGEWTDWVYMSVLEYERAREDAGFETRVFARIVVPKKEEESESQMEMLYELLSNYREHLKDRKNGSNKPLDDFMAEELEKFEIKRKPL